MHLQTHACPACLGPVAATVAIFGKNKDKTEYRCQSGKCTWRGLPEELLLAECTTVPEFIVKALRQDLVPHAERHKQLAAKVELLDKKLCEFELRTGMDITDLLIKEKRNRQIIPGMLWGFFIGFTIWVAGELTTYWEIERVKRMIQPQPPVILKDH